MHHHRTRGHVLIQPSIESIDPQNHSIIIRFTLIARYCRSKNIDKLRISRYSKHFDIRGPTVLIKAAKHIKSKEFQHNVQVTLLFRQAIGQINQQSNSAQQFRGLSDCIHACSR